MAEIHNSYPLKTQTSTQKQTTNQTNKAKRYKNDEKQVGTTEAKPNQQQKQ